MAQHQSDSNPEPIHPDVTRAIFFANERHIGFDPTNGEPIFAGSRKMAEFGPALDEKGNQEMRKHAVTGVPLVKVREMKGLYDEEFVYKKVSDGRGNVYREDCEHPEVLNRRFQNEEAMAAAEERGMELIRELGASGATAQEIREAIAAIKQPAPQAAVIPLPPVIPAPPVVPVQVTEAGTVVEPGPGPQPTPSEREEEPEGDKDGAFPQMFQPGKWYLTADHKAAVIAKEQNAFGGNKVEATDARETLILEKLEAQSTLAGSPTF